ncbi:MULTISPECIES: helix-turn-helix domain-containing protein [Clostridium]|uniref:Helix-turn-helix transcriptional regulator n=1 Tax=Clostridium frigoriphilum TaxID=443253 RepID=A0ABU7UU04_9CLOT|nr:helix-turn-helix transcriptional regulator [Clostridium sp. DSM 17811]MBU3098719.1 helix-turn-helix domain-containing protein [Clostridium sp. DSM 17811]
MIGLEFALETHKITSTQLSNKLGITKQNISMWISGERKIPKKYLTTLENLLFVKRDKLQTNLSDIDKLKIMSTIYNRIGVRDDNEEMIYAAADLYAHVDILEVKEKVDMLFEDYCYDFVDGSTVLDILENIELIISLKKIDSSTLADMLSPILYNMKSKTKDDPYIKSFTDRDIPDYQVNFEKRLLNLISSYEIAKEKYEREENPSIYKDE